MSIESVIRDAIKKSEARREETDRLFRLGMDYSSKGQMCVKILNRIHEYGVADIEEFIKRELDICYQGSTDYLSLLKDEIGTF